MKNPIEVNLSDDEEKAAYLLRLVTEKGQEIA